MSYITWGVDAQRHATVFCMNCRAVFAEDVPAEEAGLIRDEATTNHHCTPTPPFRLRSQP